VADALRVEELAGSAWLAGDLEDGLEEEAARGGGGVLGEVRELAEGDVSVVGMREGREGDDSNVAAIIDAFEEAGGPDSTGKALAFGRVVVAGTGPARVVLARAGARGVARGCAGG